MTAKLIGVAGSGDGNDLAVALDRDDLPVIESVLPDEHPSFSAIRMGSLEQAELVHTLLGRAIAQAKKGIAGDCAPSPSPRRRRQRRRRPAQRAAAS